MQYDFEVDLEVYKLFVEEDDYDKEYVDSLKEEYEKFRIIYNDNPTDSNLIDFIDVLHYNSDHNQILLLGINGDKRTVLCWYFVGDDRDDPDYKKARKDFKEMLKYKINKKESKR